MAIDDHRRQIVHKLWNYCNIIRDDGLSYGDYLEQLSYLLFLGWPTSAPFLPGTSPAAYDWSALVALDGDALETHDRHSLEHLGTRPGMLGVIVRKA